MKSIAKVALVAVFMAIVVLVLTPGIAAAAPALQVDTSISDFLLWLTAGGSVVAVSWILEQVAWFQSLSGKGKQYLQYGLSALLGCTALAVQMYVPQATLDKIAPFFAILLSTFGMVFLNQAAHTWDPRKK